MSVAGADGAAVKAVPAVGGRWWRWLGAWWVMLFASVLNGALRESTYGPRVGELAAHQISTAISLCLLGLVMAACLRRWPPASAREAWALGGFWLALTLAFEFLFFHYVGGHPWSELLANYDIGAGRVWVLVPLWIAVAPRLWLRWLR